MISSITVAFTEKSTFFLAADDDGLMSISPMDLAFLLFAWDKVSWYGANIAEREMDGAVGIELSALESLRLFCGGNTVISQVRDVWEQSCQPWCRIGHVIQSALSSRDYIPDFEAWKRGEVVWKLTAEAGRALSDAGDSGDFSDSGGDPAEWQDVSEHILPVANRWLDQAIKEQSNGSGSETAASLEAMIIDHPLWKRVSSDAFQSEEEWLLALGFFDKDVPIETCLEIVEPKESDETWRLRVLLRDKHDETNLYPAPGFEWPGESACPDAWVAHQSPVEAAIRMWTVLCPTMRNPDAYLAFRTEMDGDQIWDVLTDDVPTLVEAGYTVFVPSWWEEISQSRAKISARVSAPKTGGSASLFGLSQVVDFDWRIAVGNLEISEADFFALVSKKQRLIRYRNQWVTLHPDLVQQFRAVANHGQRQRAHTFQEALEMMLIGRDASTGGTLADGDSAEVERLALDIQFDPLLSEIVHHLQKSDSMPLLETPAGFRGELRPYQTVGYSWLAFLRKYGLGACLADDMGLGKTVQYTAYLVNSRTNGNVVPEADTPGPGLLICPTSVLGNWQKELERFAPDLRVYLHYGSNRLKNEAFMKAVEDADVVLTSYSLCHLDEETLSLMTWDSICLDEAQNIKNSQTKQAVAVRKLKGMHRIAMTGTPMENRLAELWSIFEFINPGYLGRFSSFMERFARPIERNGNEERVGQLQRLIAPFMLRRRKQDPEIELALPEKQESNVYVPLSREQAALYESIVSDMLQKVDALSAMERRGLILASLTRLKQVCDHPALFQHETIFEHEEGRSTKFDRLLEMAGELLSEDDACLIFTQFVEAGNMVKSAIESALGERVLFLHGGLRKAERDAIVQEFQEGTGASVLILSLKAGGVGLNLTRANHVFHLDRWWNPAVENQATDRAYRIGQTRRVQVYKFVSLGTLEERIHQMIERKQAISDQIVGNGEGWITELSTTELRDLFKLRQGIGLAD